MAMFPGEKRDTSQGWKVASRLITACMSFPAVRYELDVVWGLTLRVDTSPQGCRSTQVAWNKGENMAKSTMAVANKNVKVCISEAQC